MERRGNALWTMSHPVDPFVNGSLMGKPIAPLIALSLFLGETVGLTNFMTGVLHASTGSPTQFQHCSSWEPLFHGGSED